MLCAGVRRIAVRRRAAWNEAHGGQAALLQRLLCQAQMTIMYGIEGATEYAERCGAHSLQRQPAHIRQHLCQEGGEARRRRAIYDAVVIR